MHTSRVRFQSGRLTSSTGAVGPALPALLMSTSRPPRLAATSANRRSTSDSEPTSAMQPVRPGSPAVAPVEAPPSMSQMCTRAPASMNVRAITSPMPAPAPVISTRAPSTRIPHVRPLLSLPTAAVPVDAVEDTPQPVGANRPWRRTRQPGRHGQSVGRGSPHPREWPIEWVGARLVARSPAGSIRGLACRLDASEMVRRDRCSERGPLTRRGGRAGARRAAADAALAIRSRRPVGR